MSFPKTEEHNGQTHYKATCKYMDKDGLRALAALTLEGWAVHINPTGGELDIRVTANSNATLDQRN
jgi:hypothetical protein